MKQSRPRLRHLLSLVLLLLISVALRAQTSPGPIAPGPPGSDALPFLSGVLSRYAHVSTYRLEYTEERQLTGEFLRDWSKSINVAIVGPANQYRFEHRGESGPALQVSDGQTEWVFSPDLNQYTQRPSPASGPSHVRTLASMGLQRLMESQNEAKSISRFADQIRAATFVPDENLAINGSVLPCSVVTTEGLLPVPGVKITISFTFWIEKNSGLIRKLGIRREGLLVPSDPAGQYVGEDLTIYSVAELNPPSFPDGMFTFTPPLTAVLVKDFQSKQTQELGKLVGKPLPALTVKNSQGGAVSLQTLQGAGKPLLIDFWATWCAPCRESLPHLEKLYQENKDKGLVVLSIDENEDPQPAFEFWSKHQLPWPNVHADKSVLEKLPPHGIPLFLLLDPSGNVVFANAGLDESSLHAAVSSLTTPVALPAIAPH